VARMYQTIWDALKTNGKAEVTVSKHRRATVRQAIIKLKCEENVARRSTGLMYYGKLSYKYIELDRDREMWKIEFTLDFTPKML